MKIEKENHYVCVKDVKAPSGYGVLFHKGGIYISPESGYLINDADRQFKPYLHTLSEYFRPATHDETLLDHELTEEQRKNLDELKQKIEAWRNQLVEWGGCNDAAVGRINGLLCDTLNSLLD